MKKVSLEDLRSNVVFGNIYGVNQLWDSHSHWNFIGNPRAKHGFMYILCDGVQITYKNNEKKIFHQGELLYIPKSCEYHIDFLNTGEQFSKGLPSDILVNFEMRNLNGECLCFADEIVSLLNPTPSKIEALLREITQTCFNLKKTHLRVSKLFYDLLEKLAMQLSHPDILDGKSNSVSPAVLYLDSHISDTISIPQLAHMCLLSVSAFRKAFRDYTGMSPVQYRMHTKITKAQQLLRNTDELTVKEIAEELGFYDSTYFYRVFYKFTGQTPTQYREHRK